MEADLAELSRLISAGNHSKALETVTSSTTQTDEDGNTLYHLAVLDLNNIALRWLIKHYQRVVPITQQNKGGKTCFHLACSLSNVTPFNILCDKSGVSLAQWCSITDKNSHSPLQLACLGGNTEIVRKLVSQLGSKAVDTKNTKSQTPLHSASAGGHISCVRLLCKYKKLVNYRDMFGATALHYAMLGGHYEVCQHLVARCKADMTYEAINKMNIIHAAVSSGILKVVQYAMSKTAYKMHIAQSSTGSTVLHIAAGIGALPVLDFLLSHPHISSIINATDSDGNTASHLAALRNRPRCLRLMIRKYSANIHVKNMKGLTAYGILCNNETREMRETFPILFEELDLLRKGPSNNSKTKLSPRKASQQETYHRIPSDVASKQEQEKRMLESQGDGSAVYDFTKDTWPRIKQTVAKNGLEIIYV